MDDLRADLPQISVRLWCLSQAPPSADLDMGWLLELESPVHVSLGSDRLTEALTAMRPLGLQTTLLAPQDLSAPAEPLQRRRLSPPLLTAAEPAVHGVDGIA